MAAILFLALGALAGPAASVSQPALSYRGDPTILSGGLPTDWTIVLHQSQYQIPSPETTSTRCPEIIVRRDETIIWLEPKQSYRQHRCFDPERWRIGRVNRTALKRLHRLMESQRFFSMSAKTLDGPDDNGHGTTTTVSLKYRGKVRVLSAYSLYFQTHGVASTPEARGYAAIVNAIRALRPTTSDRFEPDGIRVDRYPEGWGRGDAVPWPASTFPTQPFSVTAYYSGTEAKEIIKALSVNYRVSFQGNRYTAGWGPVFGNPPDPENLQPVSALQLKGPDYRDAFFRPRSREVLLTDAPSSGEISLLSPERRGLTQSWRSHQESPVGVAWHPDGASLATGAGGDAVRIWRLANLETSIRVEKSSRVRTLEWNASGTLLAGLHDGKEVRIWRSDGTYLTSLSMAGIEPVCLAWSPRGNRLAVGENNGSVRLWDTRTWKPLTRLSSLMRGDASNQPGALAWNPDGRRLAFFRKGLEILDSATGKVSVIDPEGNGWEPR